VVLLIVVLVIVGAVAYVKHQNERNALPSVSFENPMYATNQADAPVYDRPTVGGQESGYMDVSGGGQASTGYMDVGVLSGDEMFTEENDEEDV
jgi:hypothetical protein